MRGTFGEPEITSKGIVVPLHVCLWSVEEKANVCALHQHREKEMYSMIHHLKLLKEEMNELVLSVKMLSHSV